MPETERSKRAQRKRPLRTAILKRSKEKYPIYILGNFLKIVKEE